MVLARQEWRKGRERGKGKEGKKIKTRGKGKKAGKFHDHAWEEAAC